MIEISAELPKSYVIDIGIVRSKSIQTVSVIAVLLVHFLKGSHIYLTYLHKFGNTSVLYCGTLAESRLSMYWIFVLIRVPIVQLVQIVDISLPVFIKRSVVSNSVSFVVKYNVYLICLEQSSLELIFRRVVNSNFSKLNVGWKWNNKVINVLTIIITSSHSP